MAGHSDLVERFPRANIPNPNASAQQMNNPFSSPPKDKKDKHGQTNPAVSNQPSTLAASTKRESPRKLSGEKTKGKGAAHKLSHLQLTGLKLDQRMKQRIGKAGGLY